LYTGGSYDNASVKAAIDTLKAAYENLLKTTDVVKATGIKITNEFGAKKLQIAAGKKVALYAEVLPANATYKTVTWESSNTKVATVDAKGVVTIAKKAGGKNATITAKAENGTVVASVKVYAMKGAVKKVAVKGKKTVSLKANKSVTLKTKVTKAKKSNAKLMWTSSNPDLATVNAKGKVKVAKTAKKGQRVTIIAKSTDGTNKQAKFTIKIK